LILCFAGRQGRRLAMLPFVLLCAMLGGCGSDRWFSASATPVIAPPPVPEASGGAPVPIDVGQQLERLPPGARLAYRAADGRPMTFELGPPYQSGRGLPCRIGRASLGATTGSVPTTYAFCRKGDQWFEMPPVVISGY